MIDIEILLKAMEENDMSHTVADFYGIVFSQSQFERLLRAIENNTSVTSLSFLEAYMEEEYIEPLHNAVLKNKTITTLKLQSFDDYNPQTKGLISSMISHVENNKSSQKKISP